MGIILIPILFFGDYMKKNNKDNNILVEFAFVVDLDLAMFKLIREKYNNPDYVDQNIIRMNDESKIISVLLNRDHINPLEILMPDADSLSLYKDLIENHMDELLERAKASDLFGMMITFLREASSVDITILCDNKLQQEFIFSLNKNLKTFVMSNKKDIDISQYTILYIKNYPDVLKYKNVAGKHIYISRARYNMEPNKEIPILSVSALIADVNIIHTIDMYRNIKYERKKNDE